ncbi:phosphoinositide phosphatase [Novymonas esmeraldas]|uniref:Phosphoinositide phosphatase n=1 Tax=Novymonas esmeraldas TaxID=1808958 RepID=A0AAW0ES94_9TRYP
MPPRDRVLSVPGLQNYRDLGGYVTRDGKRVVKYKHIYRADNVGAATAEGRRMLSEKVRLQFIIDFRGPEEKTRAPSACVDGATTIAIPIDACSMRDEVLKRPTLDGPAAEALLRRLAATFLIDFKDAYRRFFHALLTEVQGRPAVFHCTAGKDRTGVAAALLLFVLDVPSSTIVEDFLLTNECCPAPPSEALHVGTCTITQDAVNLLFRAQEFFLDLCLSGARERYGSLAAYMEKELGIGAKETERLRGLYTRPTTSGA